MGRRILLALVCLLAVTGALGGVKVDFEADFDFSGLKYYSWKPAQFLSGESGDDQPLLDNSLVESRVKSAINERLQIKGMHQAQGDPDFFVVYHVGTDDKTTVNSFPSYNAGYWGYGVGPYWGAGYNDVMVTNYTEGTLVVDIVDAESNELVWRAYLTATLTKPEKNEKKIKKALDKAFKKFPPQESKKK